MRRRHVVSPPATGAGGDISRSGYRGPFRSRHAAARRVGARRRETKRVYGIPPEQVIVSMRDDWKTVFPSAKD
jgi:hypothetical protein